jgi:hypothetical protein
MRPLHFRSPSIVLIFGLALPSFAQTVPAAELAAKYKTTFEAEQKRIDELGVRLRDSPGAPLLLSNVWRLRREWLAQYLNENPGRSIDSIAGAYRTIFSAESGQLDPPSFLALAKNAVLVVDDENAFIVFRSPKGIWAAAWDTGSLPPAPGRSGSLLASWSANAALENCFTRNHKSWLGCGPYSAKGGLLKSDGEGRPRFYIEGILKTDLGCELTGQLSIWTWDGKTAQPDLVDSYGASCDETSGTRIVDDLMVIQIKSYWQSFFACGGCEGRQMDWTIRLTPDGVEDLGRKSLVPEYDALDLFYADVFRGRDASTLASASAIAAAREDVESVKKDNAEAGQGYHSLGMISEPLAVPVWKGDITSFCFATDNNGARQVEIRRTANGLYIQSLREVAGYKCP